MPRKPFEPKPLDVGSKVINRQREERRVRSER